jgi:hypothetical protein
MSTASDYGKGDRPRKIKDSEKWRKNYEKIFGKYPKESKCRANKR